MTYSQQISMARNAAAVAVVCCLGVVPTRAQQPEKFGLAAPQGWGGETIRLPPGFARDMKLSGLEHIRFAPGMMKADSDSFFSYAFVFDLASEPVLTEEVVKEEFLKYYRGLCIAVLNGEKPVLDPVEFTLKLEEAAVVDGKSTVGYDGVLKWVEPFRTRNVQTLYLEIHSWSVKDRSYLFACVSPTAVKTSDIWNQLRQIRAAFWKKQDSVSQ